jgi:signal transduction histidine kinase
MVSLVNAFLSVSRIELGTLPNNPQPTNVPDIAQAALSELKPLIQKKELNIMTTYDSSLPKLTVDPGLLLVVFQNLLSNAVQYTPEKGKIEIAITQEEEEILIKIADTGYGIAKKDHPKIFTKLFRGDNVRERETSGNGLGMYIVKAIVDASGGKISFDSELNVGTTFYITFPLTVDLSSLPKKTNVV